MEKYFVLVTLTNSYIDLLDVIFIYLNVTLSVYLSCLFCVLLTACLCCSPPLPPKKNQCSEQAIMLSINIVGKIGIKLGFPENF